MKRRTRNTLLAILSVTFVSAASLTAFAACGGKKAKLTLSSDNGGTLPKTEYSVKVGADLADFLKDKAPDEKEGLTFAGWYQGDTLIAEGTTMPEGGLSLTAKYTTSYTLNVYTYDEAKAAYGDPVPSTSTAVWHAPFDVLSVYSMPAGYVVDEEAENDTSTASLEIGDTFDLHIRLGRVYVYFIADAPAGVEIGGSMATEALVYGGTFEAPASGYSAPAGYRLGGWATEQGGDVVYKIGDSFTVTEDTSLYAVWEKGMSDVFGGEDFLFLSVAEEGKITLSRAGLGEKQGEYDEVTRTFTIKVGEETLKGRCLAGKDYFYYFRDLFEVVHPSYNGDNTTLEFKQDGAAEYTDADGVKHTGRYEVLDDRSSYRFVSDDLNFLFDLENGATGFVFHRQNTEEAGAYALGGKMPILVLDGMGHAELHFDKESAELFYRQTGAPVLDIYGWYSLTDAETGTYTAENFYDPDGKEAGIYFTFRLTEKTLEKVGDYELAGNWQRDDGLMLPKNVSNYSSFDWQHTLTLDGFGKGTYDHSHEGTYTVETDSWLMVDLTQSDSVTGQPLIVMNEVKYVIFTYDDTTIKLYTTVYENYGSTYYQFFVLDEELGGHGRYPFGNALVMDNGMSVETYGDGFLYYYGGGVNYNNRVSSMEIWVYYGEAIDGDLHRPVYLKLQNGNYEKFLSGSFNDYNRPTDLEEGEHHYHFIDYAPQGGAAVSFTCRFKFEENKSWFRYDEVVLDENLGLTIDKFGHAKLNDDAVDYTVDYTNSYAPVYTFNLSGGDRKFIKLGESFYEFTNPTYYRYEYVDSGRQNVYQARMWLTPDKTEAVMEFMTRENGVEGYVSAFVGNVTPVEGKTDEYRFEFRNGVLLDSVMANEYSSFRFKLTESGFVQYDREIVLPNLTTDGYGHATYTPDGGSALQGTYCLKESLVVFTATDKTVYRLVAEDGAEKAVLTDAEADRYYFVDGNGQIDITSYLYLDGNGNILVIRNGETTASGTYEELGPNTVLENDPMEYKATLEDESEFNFIVYEDHGVRTYFEKDLSQTGEFDIVDDEGVRIGHVSGNGYTLGTYTDYTEEAAGSYRAAMIICDIIDGSSYGRDFEPNKDGKHLVVGLFDKDGMVAGEIACDIKEGEEGEEDEDTVRTAVVRGMPYGSYSDNLGSSDVIYLDGHGHMVFATDSGNTPVAEGTYSYSFTLNGFDLYHFEETVPEGEEKEDKVEFYFALSYDEGALYVGNQHVPSYYFYRYLADEDNVFIADDGEVLITNGYGDAVYIDKYGLVEEGRGEYRFGGWFIEFTGDYNGLWMEILEDGKFRVVKEDYIARDGVLYLYTGKAASFEVPNGITEIGDEAFLKLTSLTSIDLNGVTKIGKSAFEGTRITVLESDVLLEVGERAFCDCTALVTVNIPTVKTIGKEAFMITQSNVLATVTLKDVESIGEYSFANTQNTVGKEIFIDMHEVDFEKVQIHASAFYRVYNNVPTAEEKSFIRIVVKDIAAVISLAGGTVIPENMRDKLVLSSVKPDFNLIDLANGVHYAFNGGALCEVTGADNYGFTYGDSIGIYAIVGDNVQLYPVKTGGGYETSAVTLGATNTVGTKILFETGTPITLKKGEESLTFTITFESRYVNGNVIVDTVTGAKFGETEIALTYDAAEKAFIGVDADGNRTRYTVTSATAFESSAAGKEITIETENVAKVTLLIDEEGNFKEILSIEEWMGGGYMSAYVYAFGTKDDKLYIASTGSPYSSYGNGYIVDIKAEAITKTSWNYYTDSNRTQIIYIYDMVDGKMSIGAIVSVSMDPAYTYTFTQCTGISWTETEHNSFAITLTDLNGKARSFTFKCEYVDGNSYPTFTITETTQA